MAYYMPSDMKRDLQENRRELIAATRREVYRAVRSEVCAIPGILTVVSVSIDNDGTVRVHSRVGDEVQKGQKAAINQQIKNVIRDVTESYGW